MKVSIILSLCLLSVISCNQDSDMSPLRLNSFKMTLDEKRWAPSDIDPCTSTFQCAMSKIGENPFYNIKAYKDPQSIADLSSENFFELQIMNVNEVGFYVVDETFGSFKNYARLTVNDADGRRVYENKVDNSFQVEITRLYPPNDGSDLIGIKGTFEGTLYNRDNPSDFISIDAREFDFQKTNQFTFNQCKE